MQKVILKAEPRTVLGRKVKTIRSKGLLPGVVYGHDFKPIYVQIPTKDFSKVLLQAGESTLVYLEVGGSQYPTIIHDVMRNPLSDDLLHADFYKVNLDEKINAEIPLVFKGEAPAIKAYGAILVKNISNLKVEGLPQDLPHEIIVDVSGLAEINSHVLIKDLPLGDKIKALGRQEEIVALIQAAKTEDELKKELEASTTGVETVEVGVKKEADEEAEEGAEAAEPAKGEKSPTK